MNRPDWRATEFVEPLDRGEFGPHTRGARGMCCFCYEPAPWMRVVIVGDWRSRNYGDKTSVLSYCERHAEPYAKHVPSAATS